MAVDKPDLKTLQDVIDYETFFDIRKYCQVKEVATVKFVDETLFDIYYNLLEPYIQRVKILPSHRRFSYKPKLLAKELYGTPDLDWILIKINKMPPASFILRDMINIIQPVDIE